jgi:hypothetical protein
LRKLEVEQRQRISEADAQLHQVQAETQRLAEEQIRLRTEAVALQTEQAESRRAAAEEMRQLMETEAQQRAAEETERLEELEAIRSRTEAETQRRAETEQQLNAGLNALRKAEAKQIRRIAEAEAESRRLAEEGVRLQATEEARLQAEAEARQQAFEEQIRLEQTRVQQQEQEQQQRTDQLEAMRSAAKQAEQERSEKIEQLNAEIAALRGVEVEQAKQIKKTEARRAAAEEKRQAMEAEAQQRGAAEQQVNAELDSLRKAEAEQLQRIADAEAESRRLVEEAQQRQTEEEARIHQQAQEEQERATQLEAMRVAAELAAQQRKEKIKRLNADIAALREVEVKQSGQIQKAEAQLGELEIECQRLSEDAARLRAEEDARRQAEAEARQRNFEATVAQAQEEARRVEQEEQELAAALETVRKELAAKSEQHRERENQLVLEVEALEKLEAEQLQRIEDADAAILARQRALEMAEAEAARCAAEEQQQLAELEAQRKDSEAQSQIKAIAAKQLKAELEVLRKAEAKKLKEIQNLEARRNQAEARAGEQAEMEAQLLVELEIVRARVEEHEQAWPEKELTIKARIEALRKAEASHLKRVEKIEARLHAEQAALKTKARGAKSATKTKTGQRVGDKKQRVALLEAIRSETELDVKLRSKKEQELQTEIQALYKAEAEQLQRIEEAKARLRAQEEALQKQADEEARLEYVTRLQAESEVVSVEIETPELAAEENTLESRVESGAEALSLQPLETWQFALPDEPEVVSSVEETPRPVQTVEESVVQGEQLAIAEEMELDLQAELARLEVETSPSQTASEDIEKSMDLVQTEKGLQASAQKSTTADLIEGLKSGDAARRSETLQELAQLDEDEAFSLITNLFDDRSAEVRNAAALALHEFKPDRAASFTRALREGSAGRRRNIAAALNGSGLAAAAIDSLSGEGREKTYDAFSILFLMAKAGEVQTLLQTIEKHPDVAVRLSVIRLLTFCNQPDIIPAFRSLAVRGALPTEVRSAVMEAIYQISNNARENSLSAA